MRHVIVAGGSGQVGRNVLAELGSRDVEVRALVRRAGSLPVHPLNLTEQPFDFEDAAGYGRIGTEWPCDLLVCALGTTQRRSGAAGLLRVDRDYPLRLVEAMAQGAPHGRFALVSSVGADRGVGTYLGAKHAVEEALFASGLEHVVLRPSFLLSPREEFRPGEWLVNRFLARPALALARTLAPDSPSVWRYAPIQVATVARALVRAALDDFRGSRVLEGLELKRLGR